MSNAANPVKPRTLGDVVRGLTPTQSKAVCEAAQFETQVGIMRRVDAGMSTLRALYRRGLVTHPEPLGHGSGDANRPGKATLTALGLRVRCVALKKRSS